MNVVNVTDFMAKHDRIPFVHERPWQYRGWLMLYVQAHHERGLCGNRWGYLFGLSQGWEMGEIPKIDFHYDNSAMKVIESALKTIEHGSHMGWGWSSFRALLEWLAFGLGISDVPSTLSDDLQEKLYRTVNLVPLLESPYDYLGRAICEIRGKGWNPNAFFPTPHEVVECMVQMQFHDFPDPWTSTCDPCCGTGRFLLHASNFSLSLHGQDIDPMMILCTKINGALYAPWLVCPLKKPNLPPMPTTKKRPPKEPSTPLQALARRLRRDRGRG